MPFRAESIDDEIPTVLFPVETVSRELDSKLAMASALAGRGVRSIVGHKEVIDYAGRNSGPLIWQGKALFSDHSDDHTADHLVRNGSAIMYMQDEGGVFQESSWRENVIQKHHLDHLRTRPISRVCTWGKRQGEVISDHAPEMSAAIRVTGSPRFDICTPKFDWMGAEIVRDLKDRHGPYILVCTRFGSIAHADGLHDAFRRKLNPRIWPKEMDMREVTNIWFRKWHQDVHDFADFVVMVKELSVNHPRHRLILRPHPSEGLLFYRQAFAQFSNIEVVREGNVLHWIRGAELVVHSNCTTGIEAVLARRPVVNFLPAGRDRAGLDVEVAREAGTPAGSIPEVLEIAAELLAGNRRPHEWSPHAVSMLNNLRMDSLPILADETLAVIRERSLDRSRIELPGRPLVRGIVRRALGRPEFPTTPYIAAKRPPFDATRIEAVLEGCRSAGVGGGRIRSFNTRYVIVDPD
ncbi:MAG: hypothetical protein HOP28_16030 [Gemmatimonadales bacterium]|nr:hypothetical protein [Gemmatimonadales bacterium]